jgi:hypothetical protein
MGIPGRSKDAGKTVTKMRTSAPSPLRLPALALLALLTLSARPLHAQQSSDPGSLLPPPAPISGQEQKLAIHSADLNPKNDRIFKVIPNYATVETPGSFTPIPAREKFKLGAEGAFDPYEFPLAGVLAGIAQMNNDDSSWGQGLAGYGRRYAAGYADTVTGSFMSTGVFPTLLHEDPRYFRKGSGGFWHRSGYAIQRLFVTRTDSGGSQFNVSEFGGNAAAAGLSLLYHSRAERHFSNFGGNWGTQLTVDFVANQLKEFWPDMRRKLSRRQP